MLIICEIFKLVSVQNNQYVLNIPNNKDIPETVVQAANTEINASNLLITKSKLIINPYPHDDKR